MQQSWHGVAWFLLGVLTKSMTLDAAHRGVLTNAQVATKRALFGQSNESKPGLALDSLSRVARQVVALVGRKAVRRNRCACGWSTSISLLLLLLKKN